MKLHIIIPVWGETFIQSLLNVTLPSLMPKNDRHLFASQNLVFKVYTDEPGKTKICKTDLYCSLANCFSFEFRVFSINQPENKYQILNACHLDAFLEANHADAGMLFLNPDAIASKGMLSQIFRYAEKGKRAVYIAGLRLLKSSFEKVLKEQVGLDSFFNEGIPSRDLVKLALQSLHPETKTRFWSLDAINPHPAQFYWQTDANSLLVHAFHLHPLFLWPTKKKLRYWSSIEASFIEESIPNQDQWEVVRHSDLLVEFELSDETLLPNAITVPDKMAYVTKWASDFTSLMHLEFFKHPIVLAMGEVSECRTKETEGVVNGILSRINDSDKKRFYQRKYLSFRNRVYGFFNRYRTRLIFK